MRTLGNALASGRIAHAYLFAGPRGIGKTTTARLLARALLCPQRKGAEPCGTCEVCADAAASVDIVEIDGASNRGIEEIRTLRENVKYSPSRGRYKVYIIDEVHQLTEAAFNALLKTLEEPPAHVVFVLATTDPRDIPATVLSRVQRFDFRPIAPDAAGGDAGAHPPRGEDRVRAGGAARGGARGRGLAARRALAARHGHRLRQRAARGRRPPRRCSAPPRPPRCGPSRGALLAHETTPALEAIDRAAREGEDLGAFIRDVIELLRRALVLKAAPATKLADVTHTEANELRALGEAVALDELLYVLRAFLDADEVMRESPHPRVELEIATVRATRRPQPQALEEVLQRVEEAEARLRQQGVAGAGPRPSQESLLLVSMPPAAPPEPRRVSPPERLAAAAPCAAAPLAAAPAAALPAAELRRRPRAPT